MSTTIGTSGDRDTGAGIWLPSDFSESDWDRLQESLGMEGFLDKGEDLRIRIKSDLKTLKTLEITPEQIGDRLTTLIEIWHREVELRQRPSEEYQNSQHDWSWPYNPVDIGKYVLQYRPNAGITRCPFFLVEEGNIANCEGYGRDDWFITNTETDERLYVPELLLHLIPAHHFFEGQPDFRIDPEVAVRVLELEPGVDYKPEWCTEPLWRPVEFYGKSAKDDSEAAIDKALEALISVQHPQPGITVKSCGDLSVVETSDIGNYSFGKDSYFTINGEPTRGHIIPDERSLWKRTEHEYVSPQLKEPMHIKF